MLYGLNFSLFFGPTRNPENNCGVRVWLLYETGTCTVAFLFWKSSIHLRYIFTIHFYTFTINFLAELSTFISSKEGICNNIFLRYIYDTFTIDFLQNFQLHLEDKIYNYLRIGSGLTMIQFYLKVFEIMVD